MQSGAYRTMVKTRIGLTFDQPFFGRVILQLQLVEDETCDTGYTDGKVLGFNPSFVDSLDHKYVKFFCAHEVMHVALLHHLRRGGRDAKRWNVAADHAANLLLESTGDFFIPREALCDHRFTDMSVEAIYKQLSAEGNEEEPGAGGEVRDMPGEEGESATAQEKQVAEQMTKALVSQAAQCAKSCGNLNGGLGRMIDDLLTPAVPWKEVLREFVSEKCRNDYSWSRPNRRYMQQGLIFPSLYSTELGEVCVAIDTSCSMSEGELARAAAEITGILEDFPAATVRVIYCDTQVYEDDIQVFDQEDFPVTLDAKGGGGTRFQPVFDYIDKLGEDPVVLLYMTDMCGRFPDREPDYPVIWGNTTDRDIKAPWGTVVRVEVDDG